MAFPAVEVQKETAWSPLLARWKRIAQAIEGYPLERIGMAALAAGIVLRILTIWTMDFRSDGNTYVAMGHAWMMGHEFLLPYGDVTTWGPTDPQYSHHYPPAYPFYLGIWFTLFGFGLMQAKVASVVISLAALAAVYFTSRNLYGATAAALVTGLLALEPHLIWVTGTGFSENMVLLFFALTMWAIMKSLEDDRYVVFAGLFAGLAYLSRSSVGYFFVVAGLGGFVWRFYYRRWKLFTNVWYMLAVLVFGSIVLAWAARNVSLFGWGQQTFAAFGQSITLSVPNWETSTYVNYVGKLAWEKNDLWSYAMMMKAPFFIGFLAWYVVPFAPEAWRATKRIREERTSALWLSVFLIWVLAWIITSMFWVFEKSFIYWLDNHRYVVIGLLPLGWLLIREMRLERAGTRIRIGLLMLSLFAACAGTFLSPVHFSDLRAAEAMDPHLQDGDEIGLGGGTIKYAFYAYLTHPEKVQIYGCTKSPGSDACLIGRQPEFIVTLTNDQYGSNYTLVSTHLQTFWNGGVMTAKLYARTDVVAERGIPTGILEGR